MAVTVEPDGLTSVGTGLAGSASGPGASMMCQPPAGDPVSVWMASVFDTAAASVSALLSHASAQRAAGGASLSVTAQSFQQADGDNAAAITALQPSGLGVMLPNVVAAIPAPVLPGIPPVPPPAPMPGEVIAALVHAGPGSGSLRAMGSQLRATAGLVSDLASDTRRYGSLVDANWDDGRQQAGANVAAHAQWLDGVHAHLSALAGGVDQAAGHVDTLVQQVPRPEEFSQAKQRVTQAMQQYQASGGLNPAPVTAAVQQLVQKQTAAVGAQQAYQTAAAATAAGLPAPLDPAPPIVKGGKSGPHGRPKDGKTKIAGQDDPAVPGGPPIPGAAAGSPVAAAPAMVAQIAGTVLGAGTGAVGQLTQGLQGLVSAPMSALSSLTSGMGGSGAIPAHSLGLDHDLGGMPDSGGDAGGSGDSGGGGADPGGTGTIPAGAGPVSSPSVSAVPSAALPSSGIAVPPAQVGGTAGPGMGGMGMMPPMMGMGGRPGEQQRNGKDQRVVLRVPPNSEPVFGELERRRPRRRNQPQEEDSER